MTQWTATLILTVFIGSTIAHGQSDTNKLLLSSISKTNVFHIELNEKSGTVFRLGQWMDKGGSGYSIILTDTVIKQSDASGFYYSGKKTWLQKEQGKIYLIFNDGVHHQNKRVEIDTTKNKRTVFDNINNAYWWDNFNEMSRKINAEFPLYHYSFRNGFGLWKSLNNKDSHFKDFIPFADVKINKIRDSITVIQTHFTQLTNKLISNISNIEYLALKDSLSKLPAEPRGQSWYFGTVIHSVCLNRPELFFKLAEDMPDKKDVIFSAVNIVYKDKEIIKKFKAVDTNLPTKKEFFRERRNSTLLTIKVVTLYSALFGLVVYALLK